jgi:plastocyanin
MKRLTAGLVSLALMATVAACSGSGGSSPASLDPSAIRISANALQFSTSTIAAPAEKAFQIAFENQESSLHNVAIYTDSGAGTVIFRQDPFAGPRTVVYDVPALSPGSYYFRCDVHPAMNGTVTAGQAVASV